MSNINCTRTCTFSCIYFFLAITLPITLLVMNEYYKDELVCTLLPPTTSYLLSNSTNDTSLESITIDPPNSGKTNLIYKWIMIHGIFGIIAGFFEFVILIFVLLIVLEKNDMVYNYIVACISVIYLSVCINIFIILFRLIWLIFGSILFWRDCPDFYPMPMNNLINPTFSKLKLSSFLLCITISPLSLILPTLWLVVKTVPSLSPIATV